ncbi:hypothetical protein [Hafnia alvei]|nr:hypothetical protein [Hafnia alvei]
MYPCGSVAETLVEPVYRLQVRTTIDLFTLAVPLDAEESLLPAHRA